jgi:hypothetical protein
MIGTKLKMIKKIVSLVLFTPIHAFATALMMQKFLLNPSRDPSAIETVFKNLTFVFSLPVLYPFMRFDPDGEWFPRWFQYFSVFLNSFVWALLLMLLFYIVKRLCTRRKQPDTVLG